MEVFRAENLNWHDEQSFVCLPHSLTVGSARDVFRLLEKAPNLLGHLWISSSGSSQRAGESLKWIALSKNAFLTSADSSNDHLGVGAGDAWGLVLPLSHVGGLSILARAELAGIKVHSYFDSYSAWDPEQFCAWVNQNKITLLSLVPTQVFDLCRGGWIAPPSLRAALVGGGKMETDLYIRARDLGWPCLPTFGMTECCSQIATAEMTSLLLEEMPPLKLLSHVSARTDDDVLLLQSASLLTGYIQKKQEHVEFYRPVENGWYRTNDFAALSEAYGKTFLDPLGRASHWAKIKGYNVFLPAVRESLRDFLAVNDAWDETRWLVAFREDPRDGAHLVFVHRLGLPEREVREKLNGWRTSNANFPEIMEIEMCANLPRGELGKDKIWL